MARFSGSVGGTVEYGKSGDERGQSRNEESKERMQEKWNASSENGRKIVKNAQNKSDKNWHVFQAHGFRARAQLIQTLAFCCPRIGRAGNVTQILELSQNE
eukprot:1698329-Pleurochrysis_carterae.AAC.3